MKEIIWFSKDTLETKQIFLNNFKIKKIDLKLFKAFTT